MAPTTTSTPYDRTSRTQRLNRPYRYLYVCHGNDAWLPYLLFPEFARWIDNKDVTVFDLLPTNPEPTEDDLLFSSYQKAEQCGFFLPQYDGHILNFPGTMLFLNNEVSDLLGGPRPLDDDRRWPCLSEVGDGTTGRWTGSCLSLQGTVASQATSGPYVEVSGGRFNYLPPSDRAYVLGAHEDTDRSMRFPLATRYGTSENYDWHYSQSLYWLFDPARKPRNTGGHFAVFLSSNCIGFRDSAAKRIAQLGELHVTREYNATCRGRVPEPNGGEVKMIVNSTLSKRTEYWSNWEMFQDYKV